MRPPVYRGDVDIKNKKILKDPFLCASLDLKNVFSRKVNLVITPALKAAGFNIENITISKSTIQRTKSQFYLHHQHLLF